MNETSDVKDLQKEIADVKKTLEETKAQAVATAEAKSLVESKLNVANDLMNRKDALSELLKPLSKSKKELMVDLLESVKTENLEKQFNKYLPSVLDGDVPAVESRKAINESVVSTHTGNKNVQPSSEDEQDVVEINQIRKLAGLSN